jgi:hypothetical protein
MEKWFNYLENLEPGDYYIDDYEDDSPMPVSPMSAGIAAMPALVSAAENNTNPPANIVFCIDTRSTINSEDFNEIKANIRGITEWALETYSDIKIYFYTQRFSGGFRAENALAMKSGQDYFTNIQDAEAALNAIQRFGLEHDTNMYDFVEATRFMIEKCSDDITIIYHIVAAERVMGEVNKAKELSETVRDNIGRVYVSTIAPIGADEVGKYAYASQLAEISGGIVFSGGL